MRNRIRAVHVAVILVILIAILVGVSFYRSHVLCQSRSNAFRLRVARLRADAQKEMRIGTRKADVEYFFRSHDIGLRFADGEATGGVRAIGCGPLGCGDIAAIQISVEVDSDGTVIAEPKVFGYYTDCM